MAELKFREPVRVADVLVSVAELKPASGSSVVIKYPAGLLDATDLLKEIGREIAAQFSVRVILLPDNFTFEEISKEDLQRLGFVSAGV